MNKFLFLILLAVFMVLAGCQSDKTAAGNNEDTIEDRPGELVNEKRFQEFLENLAQGRVDQIQIIHFTIEGDPIYQDLIFDGMEIKSVVDSTKDKYGSGEITETACKTIEETELADRIEYVLEGCSESAGDNVVLVKWK